EVEVLSHVLVALAWPRVANVLFGSGDPLYRVIGGIANLLVEEASVPGRQGSGMIRQPVRGREHPLIPLAPLPDDPRPEVAKAVVRTASSDEVGGGPDIPAVQRCV